MRLAASNIAWEAAQDEAMYEYLASHGVMGLEIAPTRIFPERPYEHLAEAERFRQSLKRDYGLRVVSMQSIWYGRQERLFGSPEERQILRRYTERAVDFAAALECPNLVFGCPRNRVRGGAAYETAVEFFRKAGDYALAHGTRIAIEANPEIYGTDFINGTSEAFALAQTADSAGLGVNLDVGTMVENGESIQLLRGAAAVHHVHLSEPYLAVPQKRDLHGDLAGFLRENDYGGWVSLEMKPPTDSGLLYASLDYLAEVFGNVV